MEFNKITAAEAAALIQNGQTIGLSGFTPAGVPKCTPAEIAKISTLAGVPILPITITKNHCITNI